MHANLERLMQLNDAWMRGDMEAANGYWTDDVVWYVPGRHALAGEHRGKDAMNALIGRFMEITAGTIKLEPLDAMADDHHIVAVFRGTATRPDGMTLDVEDANAILVDDQGKFTTCWWLPNDQAQFDAFWQ